MGLGGGLERMHSWGEEVDMPPEAHRLGGGLEGGEAEDRAADEQARDARGRWVKGPNRVLEDDAPTGRAWRGGDRPRVVLRRPRRKVRKVTRVIDFGLFRVVRTVTRERGY